MYTEKIEFNLGKGLDNIIKQAEKYEVSLYRKFIKEPKNNEALNDEEKQTLKKFLNVGFGFENPQFDDWIKNPDAFIEAIVKKDLFNTDTMYMEYKNNPIELPRSSVVAFKKLNTDNTDNIKTGWLEEAIEIFWAREIAKGKGGIVFSTAETADSIKGRFYDIEIRFPDISLYSEIKASLNQFHIGSVSATDGRGGLDQFGPAVYQPIRDYLASINGQIANSNSVTRRINTNTRGQMEIIYTIHTDKINLPDTFYEDLGSRMTEVQFQKTPIYKSGKTIKLSSEILKDLRDSNKASVVLGWDGTFEGEEYSTGLYDPWDPSDKHDAEEEANKLYDKIIQNKNNVLLKNLDLWYGKPMAK